MNLGNKIYEFFFRGYGFYMTAIHFCGSLSIYKTVMKTVNARFTSLIKRHREWTFSLKEMLLWIHIRKNNIMLKWHNLFFTITQLLASLDVNWWTGVVWKSCGLSWCFDQLFELILTAPIHCRGSITEQVMQY